ncbi:MAG: hypothetical protein Q9157_003582 [Trypethelium eluteriae]
MSSYVADVPTGIPFDPQIRRFFEEFYAVSDSPTEHERYANHFTPDATVIMASNKFQGTSDILQMRKFMWERVATRLHRPEKIFPFGMSSDESMLYGTVDYVFKDGNEATTEWAAHAHFRKTEQGLKMDFYQVYLVRASSEST